MVSIVINTYNRKASLLKTIETVLKQTYKDFELIIVDDGSSDGTGLALEPLIQSRQIRYVWQENAGVAFSRNLGIGMSSGEYVSFLDSDIECTETWLERVIDTFTQDASIGIIGTLPIPGKYIKCANELQRRLSRRENPCEEVSAVGGGVCTIRKDIFRRIGILDDVFKFGWEDIEMCWRAVLCGYRIVCLYEVLTFHMKDASAGSRLINRQWEYENVKNQLYLNLKLINGKWLCHAIPSCLLRSFVRAARAPQAFVPIAEGLFWNFRNLRETLKKRKQVSTLFTNTHVHLQALFTGHRRLDMMNAMDFSASERAFEVRKA